MNRACVRALPLVALAFIATLAGAHSAGAQTTAIRTVDDVRAIFAENGVTCSTWSVGAWKPSRHATYANVAGCASPNLGEAARLKTTSSVTVLVDTPKKIVRALNEKQWRTRWVFTGPAEGAKRWAVTVGVGWIESARQLAQTFTTAGLQVETWRKGVQASLPPLATPSTTSSNRCPTAPPTLGSFNVQVQSDTANPATGQHTGIVRLSGTVVNSTNAMLDQVNVKITETTATGHVTGGTLTPLLRIAPGETRSFSSNVPWIGALSKYEPYLADWAWSRCS